MTCLMRKQVRAATTESSQVFVACSDNVERCNSRGQASPLAKRFEQLPVPASPPGEP